MSHFNPQSICSIKIQITKQTRKIPGKKKQTQVYICLTANSQYKTSEA